MLLNPFRRWSEEDVAAALERSIERLAHRGTRGMSGSTAAVAAREPAHAFELRPLLDAALELRTAYEPAAPSPAARAQLLALIRNTPQEPAPATPKATRDAPAFAWALLAGTGGLRRGFATAAATIAVGGLVLLGGLGRAPSPAAAATLTVVAGDVQRVGGASPGSVVDGAAVFEGDTLRLGPDALAILTFADGSTVQLSGGAELTVARARFEAAPAILVEQRAGQLIADLPAGADQGSSLTVEAPGAVIEAHVGGFAADVSAQGTRVQAFEHSVAVNTESRRPEVLVPGESRLIEAPAPPREKPAASPPETPARPSAATGAEGNARERGELSLSSPPGPRKQEQRGAPPDARPNDARPAESPALIPSKPAKQAR